MLTGVEKIELAFFIPALSCTYGHHFSRRFYFDQAFPTIESVSDHHHDESASLLYHGKLFEPYKVGSSNKEFKFEHCMPFALAFTVA